MKPKHQRLWFLVFGMVMLAAAATLILRSFNESLVFFYSPSDLQRQAPEAKRYIRLGGLVMEGSIRHPAEHQVSFALTDGSGTVEVTYTGALPALFREGQGVVAEGRTAGPSRFAATRILAKHDERYMPPEVSAALKKQGVWRGNPNASEQTDRHAP